jgi:quercetin dioxygenase-like cupin family protein
MQALNIVENPRFESEKASKLQAVKSPQLAVDGLFLRAGQAHGPMRLPERDRVVVCVQGQGELVIHTEPVDQRIELKPGMVALAPKGTWHAIIASGGSDLIVSVASQFPVRVEERG